MNKYKRLKKVTRNAFVAGLLLFFIFLTWMFSPVISSINSVGKDFFLVDKSNIVVYVRSRLISTIKDFNLTDGVRVLKSIVLNESRNKNSGEMVIYDPNLPTESLKDRMDAKQPPYNINLIERYTPSLKTSKNKGFSTNTGGIANTRFYETHLSSKNSIKENIELAHVIDSSEFNGTAFLNKDPVQSSPLFHEGILYFVTRENSLAAWHIEDNNIIFNLKFIMPPAQRGMALYQDDIKNETTLYFIVSSYLVAVNALTGKLKKDFGTNGYLKVGFGTAAPIVFDNTVIISTNQPSSILAVNKLTGKEIWRKYIDGGSPWGGITLDDKRGILFITTGNPKPPLYGGERLDSNKESNSLIAINVLNGSVIWSFQDVIHDLWDFDIASPPALASTRFNGKLLDVVIAPSKRGNLIVADRETGKLLEEPSYVKAPISDVAGEKTSAFQPLINFPEPFLDHAFKQSQIREDIAFKTQFNINDYKFGFFEPPSLKKTLITYGLHGGAGWPGVSIDLNSDQLFVAVNKVPWKLRLFLQDSNLKESTMSPHKGKDLYIKDCSLCHGEKRNGSYRTVNELEYEIYPSLVGVESTNAIEILSNSDLFKKKHKNKFDSYPNNQLKHITDYFKELDKLLYEDNRIKLHYMWSMFIDESGIPINKPPYGEVVSYDLNSFKINWKIPVGNYSQYSGASPTGQFIYGGMATTSDGVLFVTGGPDRFVRAFDTANGEMIWSYQMEAAGSSPPIVFKFNSDNYLAVVATGGKFSGYDKKSSNLYLFKF
jgi:quinoprotein glucose dehydrogenase